ncbi:DedA family protein [Deferribacterales bacterium RsTz2092]|nr:membrane protein [Deferribacterales bacterium]
MQTLINFFALFVTWLVNVVGSLGYLGIILLMAVESSFIPFPSEVVIPPAGYLTLPTSITGAAYKMNVYSVITCGVMGSVLGATLNYYLGLRLGRTFLLKYGKYLFLPPEKLAKMDAFFNKHGEITTLIGRLIPVVRQFISFPAGLARMDYRTFAFYTTIGSLIWVTILLVIGRAVGTNIELIKQYSHTIVLIMAPVIVIGIIIYVLMQRRKPIENKDNQA